MPRPKNPKNAKREAHLVFVAQAKMLRVFESITLLSRGRWTIQQIAERFDVSERTAYRYLRLVEALELPLEKTFEGKQYFITADGCPVCGKLHNRINQQQHTTK